MSTPYRIWTVTLLFLLMLSQVVYISSTTICIQANVEKQGCDYRYCDTCSYGSLTQSLLSKVKDNTQLKFLSSRTMLSGLVQIINRINISLIGSQRYNSAVYCESNDSGLMFKNVTTLEIAYTSFHGCGAAHKWLTIIGNKTIPFMASIYIYFSVHVKIWHVTVEDGNGTGLALIDTTGKVEVLHSIFRNNSIKGNSSMSGGRGVYVDFTYCPPGTRNGCENRPRNNENSLYVFNNSVFNSNVASHVANYTQAPLTYRAEKEVFQEVGSGGGLNIYIRANATANNITIDSCHFLHNTANLGGGLLLSFHDSPKSNFICIRSCMFNKNEARNGGGGLDVGFLSFGKHLDTYPAGNRVIFHNCTVTANMATYGGGTKVFSTRSFCDGFENSITFHKSRWIQNKARFGSAVEMSPHVWEIVGTGYFPTVVFNNCNFSSNYREEKVKTEGFSARYVWGEGTFLVTVVPVIFSGRTLFNSSNGSALYISSGTAEFTIGSFVHFNNNTAYEGGAVALVGFSALRVQDNSTYLFTNNKAINRGGAIISESNNKLDFVSSRSCFIQYIGNRVSVDKRGVLFQFLNNKVINNKKGYGQTIYATTVIPCRKACIGREGKKSKHGLDCIGMFEFKDQSLHEISTSGAKFKVKNSYIRQPVGVIPGQEVEFQFKILDDLDNETFDSYHVLLGKRTSNYGNIKLDPLYRYITDKNVKLYGTSGARAQIQLGTTGIREISIGFEIQMKVCPPGYVIEMNRKHNAGECVCSANTPDKTYIGIDFCNEYQVKAYLKHGYWFGYDGVNETEDTLRSGYCPRGFCAGKEAEASHNLKPSNVTLGQFVCSKHRQGKLCGGCMVNTSHYYHSDNFGCLPDKHCDVGLLLYIVSELVPVSILFIVLIIFNVRLTSGAMNGFIFFIQFIDTMRIDANGFITVHPIMGVFISVYKFIYRMFNLNFFTLDSLSFCLWKGANTLDVLAFKYVTIIYSFMLVFATVVSMKFCNITRLRNTFLCKLVSPLDDTKGVVIHGISTFIVMCYSQCAKVTLFLLTPTLIYSMGPPNEHNTTKVVFYAGDMLYFHSEHLKYALPALFFAITVILIPPLLLVVYPLCYRLFALLRLEESAIVHILCKIAPLEKMKPQFDSFQGCFKDKFRFFSGLYFLYRLVALITFLALESLTKFYIALQIQLILMFTLQATTHAYKKYRHNILDTVLFADLAIINALTIFNYKTINNVDKLTTDILSGIQTLLVMLPLVYVLVFVSVRLVRRMKKRTLSRTYQESLTDTLSIVEYRDYHQLQ